MMRNDLVLCGAKLVVEEVNEDGLNLNHVDLDCLHDILLNVRINGVRIEDDDELYNEMVSLLDDDLAGEIRVIVEDEIETGIVLQEQIDGYYSDRV